MRVVTDSNETIELGITETAPTISITDFSRRVMDDFGVTTVVPRKFSRRLSARIALATTAVDQIQRRLAGLRAVTAQWVADDLVAWLSVRGFLQEFEFDVSDPRTSFCTLSIEGLAESETVADAGGDPAPDGAASSLRLLQPVAVTNSMLVSSTAPEGDYPAWASSFTYAKGARVISTATHRVYESAGDGNVGNDPTGTSGRWLTVGPTNRWAMFDEALGTATTAGGALAVVLNGSATTAIALIDVTGAQVRVQAAGYDQTKAAGAGAILFGDLPNVTGQITVTVTGSGAVAVGTLLIGRLVGLGITEASPTAGITDYSRKVVDDFGEVTVAQRAWAKRMAARALIRTDAVDQVANRIASVRARPCLWVADSSLDSVTIYGFFKDFSIEVGERVSKLSLSVEGLSKAAPIAAAPVTSIGLVPRGVYDGGTVYSEGDVVQYQGSSWYFIAEEPSSGNAPPTLPTTENSYWRILAQAGDGTPGRDGASAFTFVARAGQAPNLTFTGNSVIKTGGDDTSPTGQFYVLELRNGACELSFAVDESHPYALIGLHRPAINPDNAGLSHVLYAWHTTRSNNANDLQILEGDGDGGNNDFKGSYGKITGRVVLGIRYDGNDVTYLKDGQVVATRANVGTGLVWRLLGAIYNVGARIDNLTWTSPGLPGTDGANAPLLRVQWSINGIDNWHDNYFGADAYQRQSSDGGLSYGPAYKVVGEDGTIGADGTSPSTVFKRSATVPAAPADSTGNPPSGWTDGPPAGTDFLWQSKATFRGATQLTPWSAPVRISGDDGIAIDPNVASITFEATYAGVLKAGQLNKTAKLILRRGTSDISTSATWVITQVTNATASISADGTISFSAVSAAGYVDATATFDGKTYPKRVPFSFQKDQAPPQTSYSQTAPANGQLTSTTFAATPYPVVTLTPNAQEQINAIIALGYNVDNYQGGTRQANVEAKAAYRALGTTTWSDFGAGAATGQPSVWTPQDKDPGGLSATITQGGLDPSKTYDIGLFMRLVGTTAGTTATVDTGTFTGRSA